MISVRSLRFALQSCDGGDDGTWVGVGYPPYSNTYRPCAVATNPSAGSAARRTSSAALCERRSQRSVRTPSVFLSGGHRQHLLVGLRVLGTLTPYVEMVKYDNISKATGLP